MSTGFFDTHYTDKNTPFVSRAEGFFADLGINHTLVSTEHSDDEDHLSKLILLIDDYIADNDDVGAALIDLRRLRDDADDVALDADPRFVDPQFRHCLSAETLGAEVYQGLVPFGPMRPSGSRIETERFRKLRRRQIHLEKDFFDVIIASDSCGLLEMSRMLFSEAVVEEQLRGEMSVNMVMGDTYGRLNELSFRFREGYLRLVSEKIQLFDAQQVPVNSDVITGLISGDVDALKGELLEEAADIETALRRAHSDERLRSRLRNGRP